MLATEQHDTEHPSAKPQGSLHETWSENERMRHVPDASWIAGKLDGDIRRRSDLFLASYASLPTSDAHHAAIESEFRALCRALDRVADVARRKTAQPHPPAELGARINWAITHALQNVSAMDPATFGHRLPFQTFERSNAEPLYGAMLAVLDHLHRLQELIRAIDPTIDEKLYSGLVQLAEPMRTDPIA